MILAGNLSASICPVLVGNRKAFFRAQGEGLAVQEYAPHDKAAREIACLYNYTNIHLYDEGQADGREAKLSASGA